MTEDKNKELQQNRALTAHLAMFLACAGWGLMAPVGKEAMTHGGAVYNYVQPMVSVLFSVLMGLGVLKFSYGIAVILVFSGVWLVTKSKSRRDMERDMIKQIE